MHNFSNIPAKDNIVKSGLYKIDHKTTTNLEPDRTVYYNIDDIPEQIINKNQLKNSLKKEKLSFEAIIRTRNTINLNPNWIVFASNKNDEVYRFRYNDESDLHYKNGPEKDLYTAISKAECFGYFEMKDIKKSNNNLKVIKETVSDNYSAYERLNDEYTRFVGKIVDLLDGENSEEPVKLFGNTYKVITYGSDADDFYILLKNGDEVAKGTFDNIFNYVKSLEKEVDVRYQLEKAFADDDPACYIENKKSNKNSLNESFDSGLYSSNMPKIFTGVKTSDEMYGILNAVRAQASDGIGEGSGRESAIFRHYYEYLSYIHYGSENDELYIQCEAEDLNQIIRCIFRIAQIERNDEGVRDKNMYYDYLDASWTSVCKLTGALRKLAAEADACTDHYSYSDFYKKHAKNSDKFLNQKEEVATPETTETAAPTQEVVDSEKTISDVDISTAIREDKYVDKNLLDNYSGVTPAYVIAAKTEDFNKMEAWNQGTRRQNVKACSDEKLKKYMYICQVRNYNEEYNTLKSEFINRGGQVLEK